MPPPVTRSSSAMPVGSRGASRVSVRQALEARRAALAAFERDSPAAGAAAASSMMLFHSPQAAHLPAQRGAPRRSSGRRRLRTALAMRSGSAAVVARDGRAGRDG